MQEQIKQDAQQAQNSVENIQYNLNVTNNMPIYPLQKMDDAEIRQLSKKIAKSTITQINDGFHKSGATGNRKLLKPN